MDSPTGTLLLAVSFSEFLNPFVIFFCMKICGLCTGVYVSVFVHMHTHIEVQD